MKDLEIQEEVNKLFEEKESMLEEAFETIKGVFIDIGIGTYRIIEKKLEQEQIELPENVKHSIVKNAMRSLLLDMITELMKKEVEAEKITGTIILSILVKKNEHSGQKDH